MTDPGPTTSADGSLACCPFRIGDVLLLCPAANVEAITLWDEPLRLPRVPSHVLGLVTYDQRALVILDLGRFLDLGDPEGATYTRTLVVTAGPYRVGIPVDAALGVVAVEPDAREAPSGSIAGALAQYVTAEVELGGELAALLDLPRLLEAARA